MSDISDNEELNDIDDEYSEVSENDISKNPDENDELDDSSDEDENEDGLETIIKKPKIIRSITNNILTKFEYARLIGIIAHMITDITFKVDPRVFELSDLKFGEARTLDIATFWVDNRKLIPLPIRIKRYHMDGTYELVDAENLNLVDDLVIP